MTYINLIHILKSNSEIIDQAKNARQIRKILKIEQ